jgi:8-oxo-dGTP diphosphatase
MTSTQLPPDARLADRPEPTPPILAASIAVFREGRVLIARRGRAPNAGLYSLPGGALEAGETPPEAALRELSEEVGLEAEIVALVERIALGPYLIVAFVGRWLRGEARVGPEASDVVWIDPATIGDYPTTPGLAPIIAKAAALERGAR